MTAHILHYSETHNITAHDRGGAYIDLYAGPVLVDLEDGSTFTPGIDGETIDAAPFDTINVWNYREGKREESAPPALMDYDAAIAERIASEDDDA